MKPRNLGARCACLAVATLLFSAPPTPAAEPGSEFTLVGEMEPLDGVVAQPRKQREALVGHAEAERGLALLEDWVRGHWAQIRQVDLEKLSRFHIDLTRGFELPAEPGELTGRPIGHEEDSGLWSLELRGPRLPARYDIVHRYLHVYASFDPATGRLDRQTITIRGWVLE